MAASSPTRLSLYQWTGAEWTTVSTGGRPSGTAEAAAFDQVHDQLVMTGGFVGDEILGDTWTWDGGVWTAASGRHAGPSPGDRRYHDAAAGDGVAHS